MKRLLRNLTWAIVCSVLALWAGVACDSATPTAPAGTILTITANPSQISLNGTSRITVVGRRPDGNPLNEGTEIFFSTDLGLISPTVTAVDEDGLAQATLRGDGRVGTANVQARVGTSAGGGDEGGAGTGAAAVEVLIGKNAGSLSVQATPSSVPETGASVQLLALVRDDQGQPLQGVSVNFITGVGTLASGGSFVTTNSRGEARDALTLTDGDLNITGDSFDVTAEAASGGDVLTDDTTVTILRLPEASFDAIANGRTVSFTDTSSGNPTSWEWDFDFRNNSFTVDSTTRNPTFTYSMDGDFTVALRVRNTVGTDQTSRVVVIDTSN